MSGEVKVSSPPVALSTSSVYPERTPDAFEIAARLGYDGVEVMVYTDPVSQDADALRGQFGHVSPGGAFRLAAQQHVHLLQSDRDANTGQHRMNDDG